MVKLWVATKAFVEYNGKILVLRESKKYGDATNVGKYDVPGGRLNPGEQYDEALIREVQEETGLAVYIDRIFAVNEWRPVVRGEQWQIVGMFFICKAGGNEVKLSKEHDDHKWIDPELYETEDLIDNLHPTFEKYLATK